MKRTRCWMSVARIGAVCALAATGLQGEGLDFLASHASAVVAGSVTSRVESVSQVSFTIRVTRVLSGSVPGPTVSVVHPWTGLLRGPARTIDQPLYGIWFLSKGASGNWDVLPARAAWSRSAIGLFLPASPTPPTGFYAYAAGTPLLPALVYETAAAVESANADPELLVDAFDSMDTPEVRKVLISCLSSGSIALQAVGIAGSLERGMPGAIGQLVRLWPALSGDSHGARVAWALRDSWRDPAPAAIQELAAFAAGAAAGSDIREAAVRALAAIHTKETLPFLASLLSGGDASEQERAVYGLSAFANGCPMQATNNTVSMSYLQCDQPSVYKTEDTRAHFGFRPGPPDQEAALATYWQAWWDSHSELH